MSESGSERYNYCKSRKVCCRTLIQVPSHHSHPVANGSQTCQESDEAAVAQALTVCPEVEVEGNWMEI